MNTRSILVLTVLALLFLAVFYPSINSHNSHNYQNENHENFIDLNQNYGVYMIGSHNSAHNNSLIASPYRTGFIGKINYPFN
jgi:hypothetical protein